MASEQGVVASALEVLEIAEVVPLILESGLFTEAERAYARSKKDPERPLAARLAAKRAAARLLGGGIEPGEIEVLRRRGGPPSLALSERARRRLQALGARGTLVSLTHGRTHAAASVLLVHEVT